MSYHKTAYSSENISLQKEKSKSSALIKLLKMGMKTLPYSKPTKSITYLVANIKPSEYKAYRKTNSKKEFIWNEKTLTGMSENFYARIFLVLAALSKAFILYVTPIALIPIALSIIVFSLSGTMGFIMFYIYYIIFPCAVIWILFDVYDRQIINVKLFDRLFGFRLIFDLNRESGMVTLYRRNGKMHYSRPFLEFDCVFTSAPNQQGILYYKLMLVHRYDSSIPAAPISMYMGGREMVSQYYRFWNMIQCYMDVSQPLPDILMLEEARLKDPTTKAYDEENKRDPNYWRSMSDEEYQTTINKLEVKQNSIPELGEPIDIFEKKDS